jgi:hypothetical protein
MAGAALARGAVARAAGTTAAETFPDGATLLVAGPAGGNTDDWAKLLAPPLGAALPGSPAIRTTESGGADGVTGANQFDARVSPDGSTALLLPGAAPLAWLVGDPRVHFDVTRWVPVFAALGSAVLVGRPDLLAAAPRTRLRIAASSPTGAELAALLGLHLLGIETVPVFGLAQHGPAEDALARGHVDAVFLSGRDVPRRAAALPRARALFSMGALNEIGAPARDPQFPAIPNLEELCIQLRGRPPTGALYHAWRATAEAAQMDAGMVLPLLTPASVVALWRRAGTQAVSTPALQSAGTDIAVRPLAAPMALVSVAAVAADASALLELRRWLALRLNWRPS